jgi:hypothetical protein
VLPADQPRAEMPRKETRTPNDQQLHEDCMTDRPRFKREKSLSPGPAGRGPLRRSREGDPERDPAGRSWGRTSLAISLVALVFSTTGLADAARHAIVATIAGHTVSARPHPGGVLLLGRNGKFPSSAIPTVRSARAAHTLDGFTVSRLQGSCPPATVDLGSWCLDTSTYPLTNADAGKNNYIWASKACVAEGGWLPTAAQLLGAASRVKLESTINDSPLTATIPRDPSRGLQDGREMTSTLVTTEAGSEAAGSEGVTEGSTGNPRQGQANPIPVPANPLPESLQYVTVFSNKQQGGFAGSKPVGEPENFRCAFNKTPGAAEEPSS